MLLVTTAIEKTWGENEDILFLGEWCKIYNRRKIWEKKNSITMTDPWSDRNKRLEAYNYTEKIYEEIIDLLAIYLNKAHGLNYSNRYWRILCGPWVLLFISSLYHKWECIENVIKNYKPLKNYCLNIEIETIIPNDMSHFEDLMIGDLWNHYFYSLVIKKMALPIEYLNVDKIELKKEKEKEKSNKIKIKNKLIEILSKINKNKKTVFISSPYISRFWLILISIKFQTIPWSSTNLKKKNYKYIYDKVNRNQVFNMHNKKNGFEKLLSELIFLHIPYNYLEGYKDLNQLVGEMNWLSSPSTILTAVDHFSNDLFKCYTANKVHEGAKLKIICHGGGGKMAYSSFQKFELDICDKYFTWGWSDYMPSKCTRGFLVKNRNYKRIKNTYQKTLVHILLSEFRYSKFIAATPTYEQFINNYIEDQIKFINGLPNYIKHEHIAKLHYDYENSIQSRINNMCGEINYESMADDYFNLLKNSKLIVITYNCTTPVEAIAMNIPTIIFWNSEHWELTSISCEIFKKLELCGVFHTSPESASQMVKIIWDNVDEWWHSDEVVQACNEFKDWLCRDSMSPVKELTEFINN